MLKCDSGQNCCNRPLELWEEIYKPLVMSGRIRFASVCKTWLSIASEECPPPAVAESWLILNDQEFMCPSDQRIYRFDTILPRENCKIVGSSNGWVLTERPRFDREQYVGDSQFIRDARFVLVNPILNAQVMLIIPHKHFWRFQGRVKKFLLVQTTCEASGDTPRIDSSVVTGLVLHAKTGDVMFLKYDNHRQCFDGGNLLGCYDDDIAFHNGKLYGLSISQRDFYIDEIQFKHKRCEIIIRQANVHVEVGNGCKHKTYLVECGGDLLIVRTIYRNGEPHSVSSTFEIFKVLPTDDGSARAVRLHSLGGYALFLGKDKCTSLPISKFSIFEEDHIYFIHKVKQEGTSLIQHGVYSLRDGSVKQIPNFPSSVSLPTKSFWFFPSKNMIVR